MFHLLLAIIYMAFIGLGLPDGVLGSAWPVIHQEFMVPVSYMGPLGMVISLGTVVSSLFSAKLVSKFGTGKITAISVGVTAIALFGFGITRSYWIMYLWAIPYGLGAGCVDACLNNYVATYYESRHMSWLHCMWGLGASVGPYVMGFALSNGAHWSNTYYILGAAQIGLTLLLLAGLPLWHKESSDQVTAKTEPLMPLQVMKLRGAKPVMLLFFCYCALEQTAGQWASSYMVQHGRIPEDIAASLAGLFYMGITVGRFGSGFLTLRLSDRKMIWLGISVCVIGFVLMLLPLGETVIILGFALAGLGCAPVYPCVIHSIPAIFGAERSQSVLGVVVACAYLGSLLSPTAFGIAANGLGMWILPPVLLGMLVIMAVSHKKMNTP